MHPSSMIRMRWFEEKFVSSTERLKVLDVGSYDVNGSYKEIFCGEKYEYTGLDILNGPNVDIVLNNPYDWSCIETDSYDLVISGQAFEHTEFFWITMSEMARVLKKDGLMCVIVPSIWEVHRFPVDCYRFLSDGMVSLARYVSFDILHVHTNCGPWSNYHEWYSDIKSDAMLVARKPYEGKTQHVCPDTYKYVSEDLDKLRGELLPSWASRGMWYIDNDGNKSFVPDD